MEIKGGSAMDRVMVIGVSTFKGFHLARRLLKDGYEVIGIDDEGEAFSLLLRHQSQSLRIRLLVVA